MIANSKGNKECLDKDVGLQEGTTYYEKPLVDAEEKLAKCNGKN